MSFCSQGVSLSGGLCLGGLCPRGLCPGDLCLGGGVSVRETPLYLNAFLFLNFILLKSYNEMRNLKKLVYLCVVGGVGTKDTLNTF